MLVKDIKFEAVVAMCCIALLESVALYRGLDGAYFAPVVVAIAGLGGFYIGKKGKVE